MLVFLANRRKAIAWFCMSLIYCELALTPLLARASWRSLPPANVKAGAFSAAALGKLNPGTSSVANMVKQAADGIQPSEESVKPGIIPGYWSGNNLNILLDSAGMQQEVQSGDDAPEIGGPDQPEMSGFTSVNSDNMVDLFSGDFSYSIPLMDVGGYPLTIGYRAGSTMDDEASWVGLGWNLSPGAVNRNLRGLPDDFKGDIVKKTLHVKDNVTVGVTAGANLEIIGVEQPDGAVDTFGVTPTIGGSLGVVYNNYRGWGLEKSLNASINAGKAGLGSLNAGLSLTQSSMEGITIAPHISFSGKTKGKKSDDDRWHSGSLSLTSSYNTKGGLKALQLSTGYSKSWKAKWMGSNSKNSFGQGGSLGVSLLSFYSPSVMPEIETPYTSFQVSFTAKVGMEWKTVHPSFYISGYRSVQSIEAEDTLQQMPSYGYLNYQEAGRSLGALLDYNRERELPYAEKPAYPHIAVPSYTYDAFSMSGEGNGGMFRAYRGDIGYVYDHLMRTKDKSGRLSIDIGIPDLIHSGADLNLNRSITHSNVWLDSNPLTNILDFRKDSGFFQAAYFRNPGEKAINSKIFYDAMGGDDLVTARLYQANSKSGVIQTTNHLDIYRNQRIAGSSLLTAQNVARQERDKRTQVITYLTVKDAESGALSKYIENYRPNVFDAASCTTAPRGDEPAGTGLLMDFWSNSGRNGNPAVRNDQIPDSMKRLYIKPGDIHPEFPGIPFFPKNDFSYRWVGRLRAPKTGTYKFSSQSDDGTALRLNDKWLFLDYGPRNIETPDIGNSVNLVEGEFYDMEAWMTEYGGPSYYHLHWMPPGQTGFTEIPRDFLHGFAVDTIDVKVKNNSTTLLVKEKRRNDFRKEHHISEINVLNPDGRRYVYGIPVYNLGQKDYTFAVNGRAKGNSATGLVKYNHGVDNTHSNQEGNDWYYSKEEMPAYAHSFLLTAILSPDYSDITGNGITDDDLGDAVKFNYSRICGVKNPFQWRTPSVADSVSFSEGKLTDYRDDKGSYVYGEKELWYAHSIESKTMVATFVLENREDIFTRDERGAKISNTDAKRLKEINLYNKSDFANLGPSATPVKTVHFHYDYSLCRGVNGTDSGKLTLKRISFTYNGVKKTQNVQNPYVFFYNSNNPSYNTKSYDRWGLYKDASQNPGYKTGNQITNMEYPYSIQDSAIAARNASAWNLDSISLPSGGSMKVTYESDDYGWVQNKRAMQLFKIVGLSKVTNALPNNSGLLYVPDPSMSSDNRVVYIKVPRPVSSKSDVYNYYLANNQKLYFRLYVEMPDDQFDNGKKFEYIPCYAELEGSNYGFIDPTTIWVVIKGINVSGSGSGNTSPLVKAATQYIRLNHPGKAYPGSETGDAVSVDDAVKMVLAMMNPIGQLFTTYDKTARGRGYGVFIDTSRSFVRLTNPWLKKMGGGHRVKRITIYDNWDKMTNQRAAKYGQEYSYTDSAEVGGTRMLISSGVAVYEPGLGAEENPFRQPIEYTESASVLAPISLGYSEEPLGESFFPAPGVGYSNVRVRTINYRNKKSANGYTESRFYTARDYPVFTERTLLDINTKKRYKSPLSSFLKINSRHYLTMSQGFKVELNDMHGKPRSSASYAETALGREDYTSQTEYFYKSRQRNSGEMELVNTVSTISPRGVIDTNAVIGKDVELMFDMREHKSDVTGYNFSVNADMFSVPGLPPFWVIPSLINMIQTEKTQNRSVATSKVINRYGIIDKVTVIDKGSKVTTENLLYDSETGDALLTRTQNEFNDPIYNLSYPSHWAYEGMGMAYKNVDVRAEHITFRDGKIENATPAVTRFFTSGDEILVYGKQQTGGTTCAEEIATFPNATRIWCIDSSVLKPGASGLFFIDRAGRPFGAFDVSIHILRSGRRNMFGAVGEVTSLANPVRWNATANKYELIVDDNSKVIAASGNEFRQLWKVEDVYKRQEAFDCLPHYQGTGRLRCVQVNGVNTGYQEREEVDVNKYSGTVTQTRWVNIGMNCAECRKNAVWYATGIKRCVRDAFGRYTGMVEREERDTSSCGSINAQSRWIAEGQNCTICPTSTTPLWKQTGFSRCAKDGYGYNTGYIEYEERDSSSCSAGAVRWVTGPQQCMTCPTKANWTPVGAPICKSGDCNLKYGSQIVEDTNPCSDSFGIKKEIKVWLDCAPGCDSLKTMVQDFRNTRQQQYGITVTGRSQEGEVFPYSDITKNGVAIMPEFVRQRAGASWHSFDFEFRNGKAFCGSAGYSVEVKFKFEKDLMEGDQLYMNISGGAFILRRWPYAFVSRGMNFPAGLYLVRLEKVGGDTSTYGYDNGSRGFDLLHLDEDINGLLDWRTIKLKIMPTRYYFYYNGKLAIDLPRYNGNGLSNLQIFGWKFRGRHSVVDWMKVLDANDKTVYNEDFSDPLNPKLPLASAICATSLPTNCETAFAQFYNQQKGTSYTFKQIDSIFYKTCGSGLNACGNNDSLMNVLDSYEKDRRTNYGVTTSYKISDTVTLNKLEDITGQGVLKLTDTYRAKPDSLYHTIKVKLNNGTFCWENGYGIEARMKFLSQPKNGKSLKVYGGNFNFSFVRTSRGMYLDSVWDNHGMSRVFANAAGDSLHAHLDSTSITDWFTVKTVITPSRYYVYMNNRLAWDTARNPATPVTSYSEFSFDPRGKDLGVDYVKLYDANNQVKYSEGYTKPEMPELPVRTYLCPTAAPDCQTAFVNYYNLKMGTSLSFTQIDSVYFRYTCRKLDVCGMKDTISNIIKRFNVYQNPLRLMLGLQDNGIPVGNKYRYITEPELMIGDGMFRRPDTLRSLTSNWWKYHNIGSPAGPLKLTNGYTIEARVREVKNYLPTDHENFNYIDGNLGFVCLFRTTPANLRGFYLNRADFRDSSGNIYRLNPKEIRMDTSPYMFPNKWNVMRVQVSKTRIRISFDSTVFVDAPNPVGVVSNFNSLQFNFYGNQGALDYFKIYNENGVLMLHETFDDPGERATVPVSLFANPPAQSCLQSFTTYFNQQYGTSYTTAQIDSLYYSYFGTHLPVCGSTTGVPPVSAVPAKQDKFLPWERQTDGGSKELLAFVRREFEITNPLKLEDKK